MFFSSTFPFFASFYFSMAILFGWLGYNNEGGETIRGGGRSNLTISESEQEEKAIQPRRERERERERESS